MVWDIPDAKVHDVAPSVDVKNTLLESAAHACGNIICELGQT